MKKKLLYIATFIATLNSYAQITFEKGYFIDNKNKKTDCYIKNIDWKDNPTNFKYKINLNSEIQTNTIEFVSEFGIYKISKYIRNNVKIDRSSNNLNKLDNSRLPFFKTEILFLKTIVEGKANLFSYQDGNLTRYFYSVDDTPIKQLIYKLFYTSQNKISKNNRFKQQLLNDLKCSTLSVKNIRNLKYTANNLYSYFLKYNKCKNTSNLDYYKDSKKIKAFNLTVKVGVSNNSLNIKNSISSNRNTSFDDKTGIRFGIEGEYVLPFNKNKWSIILNPTYQSFNSNKTSQNNSVSGGWLVSKIRYNSIEIPIGVKHSFFLNNKSKIYVTGTYMVSDISFNSLIEFNRNDGSNLSTLDIKSSSSLSLGLGYKYNDYILEFKYNNRNILGDYNTWTSDYQSFSLNIGYTLF